MQMQNPHRKQKTGPEQNNPQQLSKYTIIPIEDPQHREKLQKFIGSRAKIKQKSSLCRFYLRGICIMKPEYCKFAHSVKQLNLNQYDGAFYMTMSEKQKRKRQFVQKKQFNQAALFILKNVKYHILHQYQQSQRFKKSGIAPQDIDTICKDRSVRIRIRQILHRQNWDGFLDFIQKKFPRTNYPISFISYWYANFGFDKPQTRSKFGDFLKYAMFVRKYVQIDIVFPPNVFPSIYLVNTNSKYTVLQNNAQMLYQICMNQKRKEGENKMEEFLQKALPEQLSKKYICRYYMAGNCQFPAQQCLYAHSIKQLEDQYQLGQQFPTQYRQPVIPIESRMNFVSLYNATRKYPEYEQYSMDDINFNSTIRNQLRQKVHLELFRDFMQLIQDLKATQNKKDDQFFNIQLKELQKYYNGAGFNHTNQNKFQHLEAALWSLGYYMQDKVIKDQTTLQKKKSTIVYKIPPLQYLSQIYKKIIQQCVTDQIKTLTQNGILLQSALKRTIYSYIKQKGNIIPLHIYLRYRSVSFQEVVNNFCPKEYTERIYFESGEENVKKVGDFVRKYVKKMKKYVTKIEQIESHIRNQKKNQINFNHFWNLRNVIHTVVVDMGKQIFYWPFDNNAYLVQNSNFNSYKMFLTQNKLDYLQKDESLQAFNKRCTQHQINKYLNQRIIVVNQKESFEYAKKYLINCAKLGVDLEGRLRLDGYIDLIQISGVKRNENKKIQHKQIFIFDIFLLKKGNKSSVEGKIQYNLSNSQNQETNIEQQTQQYSQLYLQVTGFLKEIMQNQNKLKILHDCRQDSIALKYLLNITLKNVFDTSGFDVYLNQSKIYKQDNHLSTAHLIRKVFDVKVSGLNAILDTYKAPNGVNIFKDSMKKRFGEPDSRAYFQQRPINDEFLEYSARDVQDLIQVQENMMEGNSHGLARFIGELYSSC